MRIFKYSIKLLDPMFYSKEGLSGVYTAAYIHATAVNHAVLFSIGKSARHQPFVIAETNGGRNIPRYDNSIAANDFYFTPARLKGDPDYFGELVKGDGDGYVQLGYGALKIRGKSISRPEILKVSKIFSIPPESIFDGYLIVYNEIQSFPEIVRLGSFRGKAELKLSKELKYHNKRTANYVTHPVDPLVTDVKKGMMVNIFPYPIIENAYHESCLEVFEKGLKSYIALPDKQSGYDICELKKRIAEIKEGLSAVSSPNITDREKAKLLIYSLRTIISIKLLLNDENPDKLDSELAALKFWNSLKSAEKGRSVLSENLVNQIIEGIREDSVYVEERLQKEKDKGCEEPLRTKRGSRTIIF